MSKFTSFPRLKPFNRDDDFVFRRRVRVHGQWYDDQDVVPKEHFTTRRLRLLFEQRMIQPVETVVEGGTPSRPNFKQLPTAAVKDYLKTNGCTPRQSWLRQKLIEKAEELWDELNGVTSTKSDQERD